MKSHAVAEAMVCSKSLARRRLRLSQASVCSTTQRWGSTTKPFAVSARLTSAVTPRHKSSTLDRNFAGEAPEKRFVDQLVAHSGGECP